jgi:hypothetical protein
VGALITRRQAIRGGLVFASVLAFGAGLRLDPAAPGALALSVEELAVVRAIAEVMFPRDPFPVDGVEAGVAEEVDRIVADLMQPPASMAFRYVVRALEWGTLASRGTRFSRMSVDERLEVLDAWSNPRLLPRRVSSDLVRLVLGMAYFRHPAVTAHLGWRAGCAGGGG